MEPSGAITADPRPGARSGRGFVVIGIVLLVGLLVGAVALWLAGEQRRSDNVASFARAPGGCETTLDFERTGRFTLYVETSGRVDALPGACDAALEYAGDPDEVVDPELSLTDAAGDQLDLERAEDTTYDLDGFVGSAFRLVDITTPGDHVITVDSGSGMPFAIAVGPPVDDGVMMLRGAAIGSAIAGLLLGGSFLVFAARRAGPPPPAPDAWTPADTSWPSSPPGFPSPPPTTGAFGPATPTTAPADIAGSSPSQPWGPPGSPPRPPAPPTTA